MAKARRPRRLGWAWTVLVGIVKPTLLVLTKRDWRDGPKVPASGGCVVAVNHITYLDPITLGFFLYEQGRQVHYLAKEVLFRTPVIKHIVRASGQIPVTRMSVGAASAFEAAIEAVSRGDCIGIYPEGTITKEPGGWPMRGKTGAARIALASGCPVIPVGQWGVQELLPAYSLRPRLFPRKTTSYKVGDPVDLRDLTGRPVTSEMLCEATERIMEAITVLVEDLRGEQAPAERFDPRASGALEIGNPHKHGRALP